MAKSRRPAPPADLPDGLTSWHLKLKPGAPVQCLHDDGQVRNHKVERAPWQLGDGTWVVKLSGYSGGYALERVRKFGKKPPVVELPPGSLVVAFPVDGRASPWRAPIIPRHGHGRIPNAAMAAWKAKVADAARAAMQDREPYRGQVELHLEFHLRPPEGRQQTPDVTNLVKATEDALQKIVIENDRNVVLIRAVRVACDDDWTQVRVTVPERSTTR